MARRAVPATFAACSLLICLLVVARWTLHLGGPAVGGGPRVLSWYAVCWAVFAVAVVALRRVPVRRAVVLLVIGGVALQLIGMSRGPTTTDDYFRYLWDGTVQAHGIDPYRYTPLDPALAGLRDPEFFPGPRGAAVGHVPYCGFAEPGTGCVRLNRPDVNTIYPPVAEAAFLGLHWISPAQDRVLAAQGFMATLAVLTTGGLLVLLRRLGRDPRWAAVWAWCPTVWLECGNNAHIDVLGALLLVAALVVTAKTASPGVRRAAAVGALLGAAVAVKFLPALAAPGLLARRPYVLLGAAAATVGLSYLPHVLAVGTGVLGYLPGYLDEEGYSGAHRFGVPRLLVGDAFAPVFVAVVLALVVAVVWHGAATRPTAQGALLVTGTAFVLIGPSEPWYGLLLVALAVAAQRPEWLAVAAAAYPVYNRDWIGLGDTEAQQYAYLPAALLVALVGAVRAGRCPRREDWRPYARGRVRLDVRADSARARHGGGPGTR